MPRHPLALNRVERGRDLTNEEIDTWVADQQTPARHGTADVATEIAYALHERICGVAVPSSRPTPSRGRWRRCEQTLILCMISGWRTASMMRWRSIARRPPHQPPSVGRGAAAPTVLEGMLLLQRERGRLSKVSVEDVARLLAIRPPRGAAQGARNVNI